MPDRNAAVLDFLLTRRSHPAKTLTDPVPSRAELQPILEAGLRSPDHKKLEPWRLMVLERAALTRLAGLVTAHGTRLGRPPEEIDKQRLTYAAGGLAVAVIVSPVENDAVPEVEQVLSAGAVCLQVLNAALASGWGANWLTGWASHDREFLREGLNLKYREFVAGLIHIGTRGARPPERPRPDPAEKIAWVSQ